MKKWLFIIAGVCGVIIIVELFSRNTTPSSAPQTQVFTTPTPYPTLALQQTLSAPHIISTSPSTSVNISSLTVPLPHTVNLYKITTRAIPQQIIDAFVSTFSLSPRTTLNGIHIWTSSDATQELFVTDSGYLSYTNTYLPPKDVTQTVTSEVAAVQFAEQLASKLHILASDFRHTNTQFAVHDGTHLETVTSFSTATTIGIEYTRTLESLPVYAQGGNRDTMMIWVNKYGIAEKITFQYAFLSGYETLTSPSLSSLNTRLQDGEGQIVLSNGEAQTFSTISPQSLSVGYFDDRTTSLIQPILLIQGSGTTTDGARIPVKIYLPLLKK